MSDWISCTEAAELLAVDPATVRNWVRSRLIGEPSRLRCARIKDGQYMVSRREIRALLKRKSPV